MLILVLPLATAVATMSTTTTTTRFGFFCFALLQNTAFDCDCRYSLYYYDYKDNSPNTAVYAHSCPDFTLLSHQTHKSVTFCRARLLFSKESVTQSTQWKLLDTLLFKYVAVIHVLRFAEHSVSSGWKWNLEVSHLTVNPVFNICNSSHRTLMNNTTSCTMLIQITYCSAHTVLPIQKKYIKALRNVCYPLVLTIPN